MTPSSRPGASGRPCAIPPGSSRGSTGSSSTPAGTGCVDAPGGDRYLRRGRARDRRSDRPGRGPRRHRRRHRGAVARPPGRRRAALLPRPVGRRDRTSSGRPAGDGPITSPLRVEAAARRDRCGRQRGPSDDRPRARTACARGMPPRSARPRRRPTTCARVLATIPATTPMPLRSSGRRRGFTLLAVAAVLVVGGVLAAGSGIIEPAADGDARAERRGRCPDRDLRHPRRRRRRPNIRPGTFDRLHPARRQGARPASATATCPTSRLWIVGTDGRGAHECHLRWGHQPGRTGLVARRHAPPLLRRWEALPDRSERRRPPARGNRLRRSLPGRLAVGFLQRRREPRLHPGLRRCVRVPGSRDGRHDGPRERSGRGTAVDRFRMECGSRLVPRWDPDRLLPVRRGRRWRPRRADGWTRSGWSMPTATELRQLSPTTLAAAIPEMVPGRRPHPVRVDRGGAAGHLHDPA